MSYFPWSEEYSVHLRVIDNDHKDLVSTVNVLHEAIRDGAPSGRIGQIISNLVKYVETHFSREEKLMETYCYPDLARHKRIHRHLSRTVYAIQVIFASKPKKIDPIKLLTFLREWLIHHILEEDTKYTPYLRGDLDTETRSVADVSGIPRMPELRGDLLDEEEETVTLTIPAAKVAVLRRCARMLTEGGKESIAIEDIVMPVSKMTLEEAIHFAGPILR